jgi:hydrogenase nickel incorporation protein HypA/HybF
MRAARPGKMAVRAKVLIGFRQTRSDSLPVHELAIVESLLESVSRTLLEIASERRKEEPNGDRSEEPRVAVVRLEVGSLSCVAPAALHFCFDVCIRGTSLEGAALEIAEVPGRARCQRCGAEVRIRSYVDVCACGGMDLRVLAGEELRVKNLELI